MYGIKLWPACYTLATMNVALNVGALSAFFTRHKFRMLLSAIITVFVIGGIAAVTRIQNNILSMLDAGKQAPSNGIYYARKLDASLSAIPLPTLSLTNVLGSSSDTTQTYVPDTTTYTAPAISLPTPFPTFAPIPTPMPVPTSAPPLSCAGTANADNSQVYLSSSATVVGGTVTVSIELRDCNNSLASNDNMSVTQQTSDSTAKLNGQSGSINIQAVNGKASFTVSSQTAGTDTFLITDTNQHFPVTMPGYKNPTITFSNNTSGNSHCTTAGGVPNSWYSDVYPNPPVSTTNGSQQMLVVIRDCNQNPVSSDTIKVSITSGDSNATINGGSSPQTFSVQNGQANFTVASKINGTVTLSVQDTTAGFAVTNNQDQPPSISFSGSTTSSSPTPTPTTAPASTPTPTPTGVSSSPTPTPATQSAILRSDSV